MARDAKQFSDAEINRLVKFYEQAEREILDQLNRALLRGNKTEYLEQMKRNIEAILQQLREGNRTWCTEAIPRVYSMGLNNADAMLKDIGATVKAGFGAIHQQAAQVLAENAYQRFEDVVQVIGRQVDDIYRELALENVRGTVVGYDTWKQTARRYREQLAERGVTGFKDRTGRMWNMRTYTEMVARTTTMEAHLQGTANRLVEQGHDLIKVSTHRGACKLCQPWQGKILSITGRTPGYPTLEEAKAAGLFHPNCYSNDTEVYTDKGWRFFYELSGGEKILSLNPETHVLEWVDYKSVISYHYTGSMLRFKSNSLDLLVTPDHNMYVGMNTHIKGKRVLQYKLVPAGQLRNRNFKVPRTAKWEGNSSVKEFMGIPIEQFAKLLGYYLSEGHVEYNPQRRRYRVSICQHDKHKMEIMYNDLKNLGFYECHNRLILSGKELASYLLQFGKAHEKHIPDWFMEQPPEILRLFLDAYALGDGSTRTIARPNKKLNSVERKYFTSSKRLAEQIGECILKVGKYPYFYLQRVSGKQCSFRNGDYIINHDVWVIAENTSPHSVHNASPSCKHRGIHITEEGYNDMVYCVELEKNHVLWVRRNGRTAWCGNCRHAYGLYIDLDKEIEELEKELDLQPETAENYVEVDDLPAPAKTGLAKAFTKALEHGRRTGKECLLHIDANSGESVYSKVEGTTNQVVFPQSLIDFLDKASPNSIISIHNHPSSSSFSDADLSVLSRYKSISYLTVVGHDGTKYIVKVGKGLRPTRREISIAWKEAHDKYFDYFRRKVISGELTSQAAWKEHTHLIVKEVAEKFGWEYRRVMSNEK